MSYLLTTLSSKKEVDKVIRETEDVVLVLRFGRDTDSSCLQLDDIVSFASNFYNSFYKNVHRNHNF